MAEYIARPFSKVVDEAERQLAKGFVARRIEEMGRSMLISDGRIKCPLCGTGLVYNRKHGQCECMECYWVSKDLDDEEANVAKEKAMTIVNMF